MTSSSDLGSAWSAKVTVKTEHADAFEQAFSGLAGVVSMYEANPDGFTWTVEGTFDAAPPRAELAERIALAASSLGVAEPALEIAKIPVKDWLTESAMA